MCDLLEVKCVGGGGVFDCDVDDLTGGVVGVNLG